MSSFGKFVFGAFVGGLTGATLGILFAPRSGDETRRLIREDMEERYQESMDNVRDVVNEQVDNIRHRAEEVGGNLRESAETIRSRAQELSSDLEETGRKTLTKITEKNA